MIRRSSAVLALAALLFACGSKKPHVEVPPPPAPPTLPAFDAGATDGAIGSAAGDPGGTTTPTPPAGSKKITKKRDAAWGACHAAFKPKTKDVVAEVQKLAKGCEAATKMKPTGAPVKANQSEKNPHQEYKLKAAAGKCYRVYAESEPTIKDLDILVKDSAGEVGAEDSTEDSSPVLVEDGAFCFKDADDAVVIVSVGEGKGNYALQIWSD